MRHYYKDIEGWFSLVDARFYNLLVEELVPNHGRIVEVGSWKGRSLSCLLVEAKNSGKELEIFAVDTFKGSPDFKFFDADGNEMEDPGDVEGACRKAADLAAYPYKIICSESVAASEKFGDRSLDAVFIDADHSEEAVYRDILAWGEKVKVGGYIGGHDVNEPGIKAAIDRAFALGEKDRVNIVGDCWFLRRET